MDWLHDPEWLAWVAVALATGVVEILTVQFVFGMLAGGALLAAVSAAVGVPLPAQVLVFAAASAALLITARPALRHWAIRSAPLINTGTAALVGRQAVVLSTVTERAGRVKLAGEEWSARVAPGARVLEPGSTVMVTAIDGAIAVVAATRRSFESPAGIDPPDAASPERNPQ